MRLSHYTVVLTEQDCFKELFETVNVTRWILSSSGSQFQTVRPVTGKGRWPYVLSRQHGTICRT